MRASRAAWGPMGSAYRGTSDPRLEAQGVLEEEGPCKQGVKSEHQPHPGLCVSRCLSCAMCIRCADDETELRKVISPSPKCTRDLPDGPVAKTMHSQSWGPGFNPACHE